MSRTHGMDAHADRWSAEGTPAMLTTRRAAGGRREDLERMLAVGGVPPSLRPLTCAQVHGPQVVFHRAGDSCRYPDADGVLTADPSVAVCVFTADCVPLFVWEQEGPLFGLVHAGRRGVLLGVVENTVSVAVRNGVEPYRLRFLIGPHICGECYTVDAGAASGALEGYEAATGRFSLRKELIARLRTSGVRDEQVAYTGGCTVHDRGRWYSHRAGDGENRNVSVIHQCGDAKRLP